MKAAKVGPHLPQLVPAIVELAPDVVMATAAPCLSIFGAEDAARRCLAAFAVMPVMEGDEWDSSVTVEGHQVKSGEWIDPHMNFVSAGYFKTMGVPLILGRDFRPSDAGKVAPNDPSQWIERDSRHDPIIDLPTFERCQEKLAARRGGRRKTRGTFVLTGLLRCAHCGRAMVGRTEMSGRRVYFCNGYNNSGSVASIDAILACAAGSALEGAGRSQAV